MMKGDRIDRIAITQRTCRCWGKYKFNDGECGRCKATLECEFELMCGDKK